MNINFTIFGQGISFIIFFVLCMKYIWKPVISIIEKRQKEISDTFAHAEQSKKISEETRIEANNHLEKAKIEAKSIIKRANQYKMQLIDQAKLEAESERNKILLQAHTEICIERKCVIEELQKEISSIIIIGIERITESTIAKNKNINFDIINKIFDKLNRKLYIQNNKYE